MAKKSESLDDLRRRIDTIDDALHDLLIERAEIGRRIGAVKGSARNGGAAWRPGREAQVLRRLLARHRGPLPKAALVRIWRELMTAFLRLQGGFAVAVQAGADDGACREVARDHFGSLTAIRSHETSMQVLREVGEGRAAIGVLPLPQQDDTQPWWPMLLASDADLPRVIARLPFVPGALTGSEQEALVVGRVPLEKSGSDRSLVVFELGEEVSRAALRRQCEAAGFDATFLHLGYVPGDGRWLHLIDVDGFIEPDDKRLAALRKGLGSRALHVVPIGGYAVPLTLDDLDAAGADQEAAQ
ncbi:MAG: chorismate mutase [Rhodospirillaceae bacterium]|nr:chorismate mutase [Rhodospirillaceae bacterium]